MAAPKCIVENGFTPQSKRIKKDNKKALEYYEMTAKRGCHAGLSDMIRVKFIENPEYDPCEDIEGGLKWEKKKKYRLFLLTQQGGYFLFIKLDFLKSIQYFNQVILDDKDTTHMTVYKCIFLRMYETINLYHYLANEALLYLKQNNSPSNEDDDVYEVMALLETITNIHPDLADIDPDPLLITTLLDTSKQIVERENNRAHQQHHNHRGRGRGDGRISQTRGHSYSKRTFDNDDRREQTFGGNRRNANYPRNNYEQNRSGSFYGGRGRNQNNENKRGQNRLRADEDSNWRRKD